MASVNKLNKTDKRNHPNRDGKFIKYKSKLKGVAYYNSTLRRHSAILKEWKEFETYYDKL